MATRINLPAPTGGRPVGRRARVTPKPKPGQTKGRRNTVGMPMKRPGRSPAGPGTPVRGFSR